jgi:hypothetical protein
LSVFATSGLVEKSDLLEDEGILAGGAVQEVSAFAGHQPKAHWEERAAVKLSSSFPAGQTGKKGDEADGVVVRIWPAD